MTGDAPTKVLVRRPARNTADSRRRSVGADPVESAKLELVSTQTLKHILASSNDQNRNAIADAAGHCNRRCACTGSSHWLFSRLIDDADLQTILDSNSDLPQLSRPVDVTLEPLRDYADNENLSLVTTLALRKVLSTDDNESSPESEFDASGMDLDNSS